MAKDNMNSSFGNSYSSSGNMGSDSSYSGGNANSGNSYSSGSNMSSGNSYSNSTSGGGCPHTPNSSIRCTVSSCVNHCQAQDYCGLDTVQIGTHESNPTKTECVDCNSFKLK